MWITLITLIQYKVLPWILSVMWRPLEANRLPQTPLKTKTKTPCAGPSVQQVRSHDLWCEAAECWWILPRASLDHKFSAIFVMWFFFFFFFFLNSSERHRAALTRKQPANTCFTTTDRPCCLQLGRNEACYLSQGWYRSTILYKLCSRFLTTARPPTPQKSKCTCIIRRVFRLAVGHSEWAVPK